MERRNFLNSAALFSIGIAAQAVAKGLSRDSQPAASVEGNKLNPPKEGPISVAFAISQGTTWIDWVGPEAVFEVWHFDPVLKKPMPRFKLFTVSEKMKLVDNLMPDYTFETVPYANIVVIPAQRGSPALLEWLRKVSETADVTMSVCVGARHLAKAGLLNGMTATTHHGVIDQFAKEFPDVKWVRGVRFVEGPKISTGGGLTAGIDLALRVTERYFGREETQKVADSLEYQGKGWIVD